MEKIVIKGAFADCIRAIESFNSKELPKWMETKEIDVDNDTSKDELMRLIKKSNWFVFEDEYMVINITRTKTEIKDFFNEQEEHKKHAIRRLKKWFNSKEENKMQITTYLKHKKLDWILKELQQ